MKQFIFTFLLFILSTSSFSQKENFKAIDSLFAKGRYQLALEKLDNKKGNNFLINLKKGLIYESIDNFKKATNFYNKALEFEEDYQTKLRLAKIYQKLKQVNKAIIIYEKILEKDSLNLVLKYQLGKLYLITKKTKKAKKIFKKLIVRDIKNANYSYRLGLAFAQENDKNRMINSFIDTYKKDTTHIKAIALLASNFYKLNNIDSTRLFIEKGLELNENHINLNRLKVNQFYRKKEYKKAIPILLKLDSLQKYELYNNNMLGKAYYNINNLENAKKYFENVKKIDNENYKAWTYLGHIAMKEKKYKEAQINYLMATHVGKKQKDEEYLGLANASYEMKKPKEALIYFKKAFNENSQNHKALFQLAKLSDDYYKDKKIAYSYYTKYLSKFGGIDKDFDAFIKQRIKGIKKEAFLKGETLE